MLFIKVDKKNASKVKQKLLEEKNYVYDVKPFNDNKYVYFPVLEKKDKTFEYVIRKEIKTYNKRTKSLKKILEEMGLKTKQIKYISSYDTVGDIAILKITKDLEPYEQNIANALLDTNKNIKTIVKKTEKHHGVYRIQSVKYVAGENKLETIVKEAGAKFKVVVGEMFFSPRLSYERLRIAKQIKPKTNVAVFFAGVAPFSIIIAKLQPLVNKVLSIELNPEAHKSAIENVKINKLEHKVFPIEADVKEYADKIENWADYVVMPLPKSADMFLDSAFKAIKKPTTKDKKSGLITLYKFVDAKEPYKEIEQKLKDFANSKGYDLKIEFKRQVRDFSPKIIQVVIDFRFIAKNKR